MWTCPNKHETWFCRYEPLYSNLETRMHSSRMRTVRCTGRRVGGVYPSMHWAGCVCVSQHVLGRGVCLSGGVCHTPLPPWAEWQTPVNTLPCRNYVADGNKLRCGENQPEVSSLPKWSIAGMSSENVNGVASWHIPCIDADLPAIHSIIIPTS